MPRKIDVELTSAQPDGSFTWRAAGAKQPKGVVEGALLYGGAKVGDVVRAEANFDIDGVVIVSVVPPPSARVEKAQRIEIVGTRRDEPGVTSQLSPKSRERDRDGDRRGPRREGGDRPRRDGDRPRRDGDRPGRPERGPRSEDAGRPDRSTRPDRGPRPERSDRPTRPARPESARPAPAAKPRPKRLTPGNAHRDALLDTLAPEQRVVAEQLFRGGIPAVRAAVKTQNDGRAEGTPPINPEPLIALAEELLPNVREAEWRDRAEAAKAILEEVGLRDLRAVVTASDAAARGDEARALATELREGLDRRLTAQRDEWIGEIGECLGDGRVVRALRLSARPPDPTTKLGSDLLEKLATAAGEAMAPDAPSDRWGTLLEAVVASPVRRAVKPAGLPEKASPALLSQAKQAVGRVPALSAMLGVDMPPPPGKRPVPAPPPPSASDATAAAPTMPEPAAADAAPTEAPAASAGPPADAPVVAADGAPAIGEAGAAEPDAPPSADESTQVKDATAVPAEEARTDAAAEALNDEPAIGPDAAAEVEDVVEARGPDGS